MTTTTTTTDAPTADPVATLAADAVQASADASAQADAATEAAAAAENVAAAAVEQIETFETETKKCLSELTTQVQMMSQQQADSLSQIHNLNQALAEVLNLLTPPPTSEPENVDGTPEIAPAPSATPSEAADPQTLTQEAEAVAEKVARAPLTWI